MRKWFHFNLNEIFMLKRFAHKNARVEGERNKRTEIPQKPTPGEGCVKLL